MEETLEPLIKEGIQILEKHSGQEPSSLYELEQMVFKVFQPVQKAVLEKAASSLSSEKASGCKHCSAPASELSSEGLRKKTPEPLRRDCFRASLLSL